MWELSLNLVNEELAERISSSLKSISKKFGGIVTSNKINGHICILVGVDKSKRQQVEVILSRAITQIICTYYKSSFLDKYLFIPKQDKSMVVAFKKALLNFDRETDYYIIQNNLNFNRDIYLDSFYEFRLKKLKDKWTELVALANENREYLITTDAFLDLLKFLVDNLDICEEEVSIVEEEDGYKIYSSIDDGSQIVYGEEGLISSIIDMSPQKINIYCKAMTKATELLEKIYDERIVVCTHPHTMNFKKS